MMELFGFAWFIGILFSLVSGGLTVKCFFYLTRGGIESLFKDERPHVPALMKKYRKGEIKIDDPELIRYFDWIFYTKWGAISSIALGLILYFVAIFRLINQSE